MIRRKGAEPTDEPLTRPSGPVPRSTDGAETSADGASTLSQLRRRFELDTEPEFEAAAVADDAPREPGFLAEDPEDGVPTPRPKLPLSSIPKRVMAQRELLQLPLDHRAGFVLAHMDGATSIRTIVDVCGMPPEEVLVIVEQLLALRVIHLT